MVPMELGLVVGEFDVDHGRHGREADRWFYPPRRIKSLAPKLDQLVDTKVGEASTGLLAAPAPSPNNVVAGAEAPSPDGSEDFADLLFDGRARATGSTSCLQPRKRASGCPLIDSKFLTLGLVQCRSLV
jgi:hypothetical protein